MPFSTLQAVLDAMPGQTIDIQKAALGTQQGGQIQSWWGVAGNPVAGANPSSGLAGDVPTSVTAGAVKFNNPVSSNKLWIARAVPQGTMGMTAATLFLYDRLWQNSGITVTSTSAQTISSIALTRPDALGGAVEAWYQVYIAMGAGTPTITLSYTNQDGTASQSAVTPALSSGMVVGRTGLIPLASGDTGVRSIQSYTQSATMTSGTIGLVLRRPLLCLPLTFGIQATPLVNDIITNALHQVPADACIEVMVVYTSAGVPTPGVFLKLVEGI